MRRIQTAVAEFSVLKLCRTCIPINILTCLSKEYWKLAIGNWSLFHLILSRAVIVSPSHNPFDPHQQYLDVRVAVRTTSTPVGR